MTFVRTYDAATAPKGALRHLKSLLGYPALVWRNRYMLQNGMRRDLLSRVHGSFLGVYWILLQPMFQFALYYFIFGMLYGRSNDGNPFTFAIYLFSGVIVFLSLNEAVSASCTTIVDNGNLVKKVAFPSEVLPLQISLIALVTSIVGAAVCLVVGWIAGALHPGLLLLALPLVMIVQVVLTLGMGLFLANLHVFVRDVGQVWRIVAIAWNFLSPVFWTPDLIKRSPMGDTGLWVLSVVNPAYPLIMCYRLAFGGDDPMLGEFWPQLATAAVWSLGVLVVGYSTFMASKHKYADLV